MAVDFAAGCIGGKIRQLNGTAEIQKKLYNYVDKKI